MQRLQKTLCAGGILGLCLSLVAPAQAQVIYVQSSNLHAVPVAQSYVQTRTIVPRYSYSASYAYGSNYGYGSSGLAWNNRTSGPARWHENVYLPDSSYVDAGVTNQSYVVSQPLVSSGVVSAQSFVATQPVTTYRTVVSSQPVYVSQPATATRTIVLSQPVVVSQPSVRTYHLAAPAPQAAAAVETKCQTKQAEATDAKVSIRETSDGRRVKVYRYEYELDHRPGRVTIEFDSKD